ncbi:dTDP-4-dehydrorhamnose 3,5-epimerase [Candidatus Neomarinimicrobiota bacterium]
MADFFETGIPGLILIQPKVHRDGRGYFFESFKQDEYTDRLQTNPFIQENESKSAYGVLRGLHYQAPPFEQAKLVRVVKGKVLDVVVDIRRDSRQYGEHYSTELSEDNMQQLYIPRGLAHGFVTLSESAIFLYKVDNKYSPEHERGIRYDDPDLAINWDIPISKIITSPSDEKLPAFREIDKR